MRLSSNRLPGFSFLIFGLLGLSTFLQAADDQPQASKLLLTGGTIHPMDGSAPFQGDVLIVEDKIKAVGPSVDAPEDAQKIDISGCHVTPGLIESRGKLWLTNEALAERNTKAELDVVDAIDPWNEDWRELAAQGITSVYVQPSSASTLGGYGAVLKVGPFDSPDTIIFQPKAGLQASIGISGATSKDRYSQVQALEKLLEAAKKEIEKRNKEKEEKAKAEKKKVDDKKSEDKADKPAENQRRRGRPNRDRPSAQPQDEDKPEDDEKQDSDADDKDDEGDNPTQKALIKVLNKEVPLFLEVHHSDALQHVLKLAEKYELTLVLDGLSHVGSAADQLDGSPHAMVVGPFMESGAAPEYRKEMSREWLSSRLEDSGQLFAIGSFPSRAIESRLLRAQGAAAVAAGVSREKVLAALTINAARLLGIADRVGTIEAGKQADVSIFAGDPVNPSTPVRMTISQGKIAFDAPEIKVEEVASVENGSAEESETSIEQLPANLPATYVVKSARVLQSTGEFQPAMLLVQDGKVSQVDSAPKDAPMFDLGQQVITPGLVNANTSLGQSDVLTDSTESDATHLRALDAIDPATNDAKKMLAGGFIHAIVTPGMACTSAGQAGHVRLGATQYVAVPTVANQFVLTDSARNNDRFPSSLGGQVEMLEKLFSGQPQPTQLYLTDAVAQALQQEKQDSLKSLQSGNRKAIIVANEPAEIASALNLAAKHKLNAALLSSGRLGQQVDAISKQGAAVVVPQMSGTEFSQQVNQFSKLSRAGVPLAFAGESPLAIRTTAALLVSAGMPQSAALQALTTGGAKVVGVDSTGLGDESAADFVVWDGNPLDLGSRPVSIIVDGALVETK